MRTVGIPNVNGGPAKQNHSSKYRGENDTVKKLPNKRKLRNFLIRKDVQLRLALNNLSFLILLIIVLIATLLSPLYFDMLQGDQLWTQYVSANLLWRLLYRISLAVILMVILAIAYQIVLTHRLCGPLVNFCKTYEKVIQGDLTRKIHLRRHDFLKSEAELVNRMLDTFSSTIGELKKNQQAIDIAAANLQPGKNLDGRIVEFFQTALQKNEACLKYWNIRD